MGNRVKWRPVLTYPVARREDARRLVERLNDTQEEREYKCREREESVRVIYRERA